MAAGVDELKDMIAQIADQTMESRIPAAFVYGRVVCASPLRIRVGDRLDICGEDIILTQEFMNGTVLPHIHLVPGHDTGMALTTGPEGTEEEHSHYVGEALTGKGISSPLAKDDKVVLFRNHGGQQYLVLGRAAV